MGERLVDGVYEPYPLLVGRIEGSVISYSELLGLHFYWDANKGFDILDPNTAMSVDGVAAAEAQAAEAETRLAKAEAEARAYESEREVRLLRDEIERLRG